MNIELKYPKIKLNLKRDEKSVKYFDEVRKKWIVLTPEEYVRQHVLNYLTAVKSYPASRIGLEKELELNGSKKRFDIVVYSEDKNPFILVECKAPYIELTGEILEQALRYNLSLGAHYVMISNGISDFILRGSTTVNELPGYDE